MTKALCYYYVLMIITTIVVLNLLVGTETVNGPTVYVIPMKGNINTLQAFYIQASLGTPSQSLNLLVDTGSTDLIVPSINCTSCGSIRNYSSHSSTTSISSYSCSAFSVPCSFCYVDSCGVGDVYGGGESTAVGFVSSDLLSLTPNLSKIKVILAQILFESVEEGSGPFIPRPIDGIIGLSFPQNSMTRSPNFFDVLYSQGLVQHNIFSHCLSNNGGKLILGGVVENYYSGSIIWTPIIQQSWYVVNVTDMRVANKSLGVSYKVYNRDDAIVDSGTAQFIIPQAAYQAIKTMLLQNCSNNYLHGVCDVPNSETIFDNGNCFNFTEDQVMMYPEIQLVMTGVKNTQSEEAVVSLGPQYYLMPPSGKETRDSLCMGIIYMQGYEGTAVGDVLLQAFLTVYDRENMRLGFAKVTSNCFE